MNQVSSARTMRIGVMISGSGSNLQALINAIEKQELARVEIGVVISNKADARGLQRGLTHKLPTIFLPWKEREITEERLVKLLTLFEIDLLVLAGWMRILSADFIRMLDRPIINLHPALLPPSGEGNVYITRDGSSMPVYRGLHVVKRALEDGNKVSGSSVHYVTPEVDAGPVICQEEVDIWASDTEESLQERIKEVEHELIVKAVRIHMKGGSF